ERRQRVGGRRQLEPRRQRHDFGDGIQLGGGRAVHRLERGAGGGRRLGDDQRRHARDDRRARERQRRRRRSARDSVGGRSGARQRRGERERYDHLHAGGELQRQ